MRISGAGDIAGAIHAAIGPVRVTDWQTAGITYADVDAPEHAEALRRIASAHGWSVDGEQIDRVAEMERKIAALEALLLRSP